MSWMRVITVASCVLAVALRPLGAEGFGSLEDQMVVAFSASDYAEAKRLAQQIKDTLVDGDPAGSQCLSVLADVPPAA